MTTPAKRALNLIFTTIWYKICVYLNKMKIEFYLTLAVLFLSAGIVIHLFLSIRQKQKILIALDNGFTMFINGQMSFRLTSLAANPLVDGFNEMGARVESMMQELESEKKNLEKEVKQRTRELDNTNIRLRKAMEELTKTQEMILQVEKQKSLTTIVSGFAHEINNPLSGILGHIDLLELHDETSPHLKEKLQNIKKQSLRIKDIITELSQLSPEVDQVKLDINITNMLEKLVKIVQQKRQLQDINFITDFPERPVIIRGNHFGLWQVFECILVNSIEAIAENKIKEGTIHINLTHTAHEEMVNINIQDNGGGVKNIDKAFDPFYTTKNRTRKKGIGLSIAFNVVQEHKGVMQITNRDQGANVAVRLPTKTPINNKKTKSGGNENA